MQTTKVQSRCWRGERANKSPNFQQPTLNRTERLHDLRLTISRFETRARSSCVMLQCALSPSPSPSRLSSARELACVCAVVRCFWLVSPVDKGASEAAVRETHCMSRTLHARACIATRTNTSTGKFVTKEMGQVVWKTHITPLHKSNTTTTQYINFRVHYSVCSLQICDTTDPNSLFSYVRAVGTQITRVRSAQLLVDWLTASDQWSGALCVCVCFSYVVLYVAVLLPKASTSVRCVHRGYGVLYHARCMLGMLV